MPTALPVACRRAVQRAYGGPEALVAEHAEAPAPGPGEVRIRQRAIGVNYFDVYLRKGWIPGMLPLPGTPGMEAAGTVIDVGPGVSGLMPGDRVAYLGPVPGAYASVRCVPAEWAVRLPPQVDDDTAAALLLKGLTADMLLRDLGRVGPGTRLLLHAAAGGVGLLVAAWARRLGATVIGTTSSEAKARVAREHGCQHVIVTRDYRFANEVQRLCGGADVIVDGLGDAAGEQNLAALAPCGHWISLGQATGGLQPVDPDRLVQKSATFSRPVIFAYLSSPAQRLDRTQRLWAALADGSLHPPVIERYTLDAAADAHARLESRLSVGPLILVA
jgi:NADPH:quinone reductase-like Zn-dependent oxidoreductase